ncbi:hypothetical protein PVAP13_1NG351400 [Panicum virgatum]|uniref:Late embryogenesis abundant protein LEA-2 subgroup domain-containing protein n=1 Tax=Panicum virgatum TaxID=38727 RepID=A0A8T0WX10_PANVG|nr:hypothetical protein PVAP13_1NG351400 [Panicum virgatum]
MGAYAEHAQPMLPRHGSGSSHRRRDPPDPGLCAACLFIICIAAVVGAPLAALFWYLDQSSMSPEYSVAITAVSGLDPATDLRPGRGVLSPVFNLTVGIASRSTLAGGCISPGTSIRVSYSHLHLPMASGRAPDMCVGPGQSAEPRAAVARGHDVAVPGFLVDSLAEDMRRGDALFQVQLTGLQASASPEEERGRAWKVVTCWVRAGEAAALDRPWPCYETWKDIDSMPEEDSGYVPRPVPTAGHRSI